MCSLFSPCWSFSIATASNSNQMAGMNMFSIASFLPVSIQEVRYLGMSIVVVSRFRLLMNDEDVSNPMELGNVSTPYGVSLHRPAWCTQASAATTFALSID